MFAAGSSKEEFMGKVKELDEDAIGLFTEALQQAELLDVSDAEADCISPPTEIAQETGLPEIKPLCPPGTNDSHPNENTNQPQKG